MFVYGSFWLLLCWLLDWSWVMDCLAVAQERDREKGPPVTNLGQGPRRL